MSLLALLAVGLGAGLLGALLGVGGGILMVPVLHLGFGLPLRMAVGTSLVVIAGTATMASAGYVERGWGRVDLALRLQLGALLGAAASSRWAGAVDERTVAWIFAAVMVLTAVQLILRAGARRETAAAPSPGRRRLAWLLAPAGGAASGLLGIGGGLVQVPILRLLLGLDIRQAVATSTWTVGWTASVAALAYLGRGEVDIRAAAGLLAGVLVGAHAGPRLAGYVPRRALEFLFALVLLLVAWKVARP